MEKKAINEELKKGIVDNVNDLTIDGWQAIKDCQIRIPTIEKGGENMHYAVKALYMGACKRRDFDGNGNPPLWQGVEIPAKYWPAVGQKREGGSKTPHKPLVKVSVGSVTKEVDLSDPNCFNETVEWFRDTLDKRILAYEKAQEDKELSATLDDLIKQAKTLLNMADRATATAMLAVALESKGYSNGADRASVAIALAKEEKKKEDINIAELLKC